MPDNVNIWHDPRWIVTTLIAIWGASLSTFSFFRSRRNEHVRLRVAFGPAVTEQRTQRVVLYGVFVHNVGVQLAHLPTFPASLQFKGSDTFAHFQPPEEHVGTPRTLAAGDSFTAFLSRADFHRLVKRHKGEVTEVRVRARVQDSVDRTFVSRWTTIRNVDTNDRVEIYGLFDQ
jgi:hypothetical protein